MSRWVRVLGAAAIAWAIVVARARAQSASSSASASASSSASASASAESPDDAVYSATGVAVRPIAAGSELDPTASATVLSMGDRPRTVEALDEVLLDAPGARTQRTGAFGGFTTLSLRGASAEQTSVLLGEVPIASPDGSAFDLATIPTWLLSRVEVYRGGAPVWIGGGSIGGALRLIPRDDPGTHASGSGSYGSFDLYQGRAATSAGDSRMHVTGAAGVTSFGGRYPYVDDSRTALDPSDDVTRLRQGADFVEAAAMLHARGRIDRVRIEGAALLTDRSGGFAPPPTRYADIVLSHRSTSRVLAGASAVYEDDDRVRLQLAVGAGIERRHVSDPLAQVGQLPREADDVLHRVTVRGAGTFRAIDWLDLTAIATYSHEGIAPSDAFAVGSASPSSRDGAALAVEGRAFGSIGDARYEIRPSGRAEVLDAHLYGLAEGRVGEPHASTLVVPTGRIGLVLEPTRGVAIAASGWAAARAPSLVELFGDRVYLTGNAALRPESSLGGDYGVVLTGAAGPITATADVRVFASSVSNLVRYARTGQFQYTPQNIAHATLAGVEASATASIERYVRWNAALTWLHATDDATGNALPLRAPVALYTRLSAGYDVGAVVDRIELYGDLDFVAPSFADPANLETIAGRMRFGAGLRVVVAEQRVAFELVVRDIADARGFDVLGMPLAGRSFVASLTVRD